MVRAALRAGRARKKAEGRRVGAGGSLFTAGKGAQHFGMQSKCQTDLSERSQRRVGKEQYSREIMILHVTG